MEAYFFGRNLPLTSNQMTNKMEPTTLELIIHLRHWIVKKYIKKWPLTIKHSSITQSRFKNIWVYTFWHTFFDTFPPSFSAEDADFNGRFVQSSSPFKILCKHSMHIHTVNIFIYVLYLYIFLYRTWLSISYGSTVTHTHFVLETKVDTKTAFWFFLFF